MSLKEIEEEERRAGPPAVRVGQGPAGPGAGLTLPDLETSEKLQ